MKNILKITILFTVILVIVYSCKKALSVEDGIAGTRIWNGTIQRETLVIDSGIYHVDTTFNVITASFSIIVLNDSFILNKDTLYFNENIGRGIFSPFDMYGDDTLTLTSSDKTAKTMTYTSYYDYGFSNGDYYLCLDTIIYNYSTNSMVWHEYYQNRTTGYENIRLLLHTP